MTTKTLLAALICCSALACTPKRIPGTEIDDTDDTRAILNVMEKYRSAVEARDAQGIISLVADTFKEDMGTPSPEDDLDYNGLRQKLPSSLNKLDDVKLDVTVRKVEVNRPANIARAIFTYTTSFKMPGLTAKSQSDSEIKEMWFKHVGNDWKISSGI